MAFSLDSSDGNVVNQDRKLGNSNTTVNITATTISS